VESDHWETIGGSKPIEMPCKLVHYVVDAFTSEVNFKQIL